VQDFYTPDALLSLNKDSQSTELLSYLKEKQLQNAKKDKWHMYI